MVRFFNEMQLSARLGRKMFDMHQGRSANDRIHKFGWIRKGYGPNDAMGTRNGLGGVI